MIGGSYGGQIQFAVAGQDPRIDAIIPMITWNDLSYSLAPNNTDHATGASPTTPRAWPRSSGSTCSSGSASSPGWRTPHADPAPQRRLPQLPRPRPARGGPAEHPRLPRRRDPGARPARLGRQLPRARSRSRRCWCRARTTPCSTSRRPSRPTGRCRPRAPTARMSGSPAATPARPRPATSTWPKGCDDSYLGRRCINWMDRYVRGDQHGHAGPQFEYFRDWVAYDTSAATPARRSTAAYAQTSARSPGPDATLYLTGTDALDRRQGPVAPGSAQFAGLAAGTSYSETSGSRATRSTTTVTDAPGTFAAYTSPALTRPPILVGSPESDRAPDAPAAAQTQADGPAGQARPVRQALRRGARRHPDAAEPADLTGPGQGRHQAGDDRAARASRSASRRPPDPARRRGQRPRLRRQHGRAAGDGQHQPAGARQAASCRWSAGSCF